MPAPTACAAVDLEASGSRLRLEAALQGEPIWRGKFDGTLGEVFDWQDQVASGGASDSRAMMACFQYIRSGDATPVERDVSVFLRDVPLGPEALNFAVFPLNSLATLGERWTVLRNTIWSATATPKSLHCGPGRFDNAIAEFGDPILRSSGYPAPYSWKVAALAQLGRFERAYKALAAQEKIIPGMTLASIRAGTANVDSPTTRINFDGLRLAGMSE